MKTPETIADLGAAVDAITGALAAKGYSTARFSFDVQQGGTFCVSGYVCDPADGRDYYDQTHFYTSGSDAPDVIARAMAKAGDMPAIAASYAVKLNGKLADVIAYAEKVGLAAPELTETADKVAEILRAHMANNRLESAA